LSYEGVIIPGPAVSVTKFGSWKELLLLTEKYDIPESGSTTHPSLSNKHIVLYR